MEISGVLSLLTDPSQTAWRDPGVLWAFLRRFRLEKRERERESSKICMLGSRGDHVR